MRLILSRKGFDSASGGCPSPIFPDGAMVSLPIPDRRSPVRYRDVAWRGGTLGDLVEPLTCGTTRRAHGAHLDPDLRARARPRARGWRPALGQRGAAQGHLRNQGVGPGDLFLFFGLFREVDDALRWRGPPRHVLWGWLRVGAVARVDLDVRPALAAGGAAADPWRWAAEHPHLALPEDPSNTLYVAADALGLPRADGAPAAGAFETFRPALQLTAPEARTPSRWRLPVAFPRGPSSRREARALVLRRARDERAPDPRARGALSYHGDPARWTVQEDAVLLDAASRGQEFVLDLDRWPGVSDWVAGMLAE